MLEAAKGFRRVNGCKAMPTLVTALRARVAQLGLGDSLKDGCIVVNRAAAEFQQRTGQPRRVRAAVCTSAREGSPTGQAMRRAKSLGGRKVAVVQGLLTNVQSRGPAHRPESPRRPRPGGAADRRGARRRPLHQTPAGAWEGSTENATVVQGLLTCRVAGCAPTGVSWDGAQALHTAVTQTFGPAALVQRCQVHKRRNVLEHLPEAQRPWVKAILTRAYTHADVKAARRLLQDLARRLDAEYPSAAASVREGLDETLTVIGLRLSERLQRSLATTNAIESLLSRTRHIKRNVKRWRGGTMVLRWVAAGVLEAAKGFRRVNGCKEMPTLVTALRARDAQLGLGDSPKMVA